MNDIYNFSNGYLLTEYQYNLLRYLYYGAYFGLIIPVKLAIEKVYDIHESEVVARIPNWREELATYGCDHIFKYIEEYINHINQLEAIYGVTETERMENMNSIMNYYRVQQNQSDKNEDVNNNSSTDSPAEENDHEQEKTLKTE